MAWNPQGGGGGPWGGGGGQGPWGSGGPSGPQPPNIEEVLRRGQDKMKSMMPGGIGSGRGIVLVLLAVVGVWLATGFYRVEPAERGVVLLFGKYIDTTNPGLHWFFPSPVGTVYKPDVKKIRRLDVGFRGPDTRMRTQSTRDVTAESLMLTGDQNIADLNFNVQWIVKDPVEYLFNIRDPEGTVKAVAESAMREVIGQTDLEPAMTSGRKEVGEKTMILMQDILDSYKAGILIETVKLLKLDPPADVIDAFNEVQRARQDQARKKNEADAYRNKIVPTARGEAAQITQNAEAYKEKMIAEAEGEAKQFLAIYETYKAAKDVTMQRMYIETMETVLKGSNKVIVDSKGGSGVVPYLPLPELRKRSGEASQ